MLAKFAVTAAVVLVASAPGYGQTKPPTKLGSHPDKVDSLGLSCQQILEMSSAKWVVEFHGARGTDSASTLRAISDYGKCFDARTEQLRDSLARAGTGPIKGARGDFQSLEAAIRNFTAQALADSQPPADPVKQAYAALYEKCFRYEFYNSYAHKADTSPVLKSSSSAPGPVFGASDQTTSTASSNADPAIALAAAEAKADRDQAQRKQSDEDPVTRAKNHFGELLGQLPDPQMHALHASFGQILGPNAAAPRMQLLIYRFAIFLLERPGDTPFSPPPF